MVGNVVLFTDANGSSQGALVTGFDESTQTADLIIASPDPVRRRKLNSGDFAHGLERRFTVESAKARVKRLSAIRQKQADESGETQPGFDSSDIVDTFQEWVSAETITLPTSFTPAVKAEAAAAEKSK